MFSKNIYILGERFVLVILVLGGLEEVLGSTRYKFGQDKCGGSSEEGPLKYLWGDALTDAKDCLGPNGHPYPAAMIAKQFKSSWDSSSRTARASVNTLDPAITRRVLLHNYQEANDEDSLYAPRMARSGNGFGSSPAEGCSAPGRLCKTRYNTTAPMYGVSLTSGQPVTIVQKFPDLLQQVVFEVCESSECDIVHGQCTQTYVPYLFLVIPLGPVTLTGQDYVLVESGCVCKPRHGAPEQPPPLGALPSVL